MNNLPNQGPGQPSPGGFPPPSNQGGPSQPTTPPPVPPRPPAPPVKPPMPPTGLPVQETPKPPIAGGPRPPPPAGGPPPPEITLRTMKSDLESLKQTGGSTPTPKPFTPSEFSSKSGSALGGKKPAPSQSPTPSKISPSEFGRSSQETPKPPVIKEESKASKFNIKKVSLWLVVAVITVGFGFLGFKVIFPALFPSQLPLTPEITQPTPPTPIETPAEELETPPTPIPEPKLHTSLLSASDTASAIQLLSVDLLSLTNTLQQEAQKQLSAGTLSEIIMSDINGQVSASDILNIMMPEFSKETLSSTFKIIFKSRR